MSTRADVTLARACRFALDLIRTPPASPAEVHRTVESIELVLAAGLALYERTEDE